MRHILLRPFVVVTLAALTLLTVLWTFTTYAAAPDGYTPVGPGDTYLAMGNSVVIGVEAEAHNDNQPGYPDSIYQELLGKYPHLTYKNVGRASDSSTTIISNGQLTEAETFIASERANGRRVGLVTLTLGGDDLLELIEQNTSNTDEALKLFQDNLVIILDRLQAALKGDSDTPQGDLLVTTFYNPYPGLEHPLTGEKLADELIVKFNDVLKQEVSARDIPVVEIDTAFDGKQAELTYVNQEIYENSFLLVRALNPNFEADLDYNPKPTGHQLIADEVLALSGYTPLSIAIDGPTTGDVSETYTFTATIPPLAVTLPTTYTWVPEPTSGQGTFNATYTWPATRTETITVTAANASGIITDTHQVAIKALEQIQRVLLSGPSQGTIDTSYIFTATIEPLTATRPITYTWSPTPTHQASDVAAYTWSQVGRYTIALTAANEFSRVFQSHTVDIQSSATGIVFLPLITKQ